MKRQKVLEDLLSKLQSNVTDIRNELLIGFPYNHSLIAYGKCLGHLRLVPHNDDTIYITHLVTTLEGYHYGKMMLDFAIDYSEKNNYSMIHAHILKCNISMKTITETVLARRGRDIADCILQETDEFIHIGAVNGRYKPKRPRIN